VFVCVWFFSFFSFSLAGGSSRGVWRGALVFVLSRRWRVLVPNLFLLLMLDLRLFIGFLETRAAQMGSPTSSCSAAVCSGRRDHR
jgi:methyl coenzyme M reductase beta subunit